MEVILLDDVVGLGEAGSLVKVKPGYARNYLLPRGLAQPVTTEALNRIHVIKRIGEERRRKRVSEVKDKIEALGGKQVVVPMKAGAEAKLFGAVTSMLISQRIQEQYEMEIDRRFIELAEPFKYLGSYEVELKAGSEASANVQVVVVDESIYYSQGADAAVAAIASGAGLPAAPADAHEAGEQAVTEDAAPQAEEETEAAPAAPAEDEAAAEVSTENGDEAEEEPPAEEQEAEEEPGDTEA